MNMTVDGFFSEGFVGLFVTRVLEALSLGGLLLLAQGLAPPPLEPVHFGDHLVPPPLHGGLLHAPVHVGTGIPGPGYFVFISFKARHEDLPPLVQVVP